MRRQEIGVSVEPAQFPRSQYDTYRRVVARCVNAQGSDLSAIMARSGWAVDWWSFSCGTYLADEHDAQHAGQT